MNRQLLKLNGEDMFVTTVWYGVPNYATGDLTYVRAGHELPVLYTAEGALIEPSLDGSQLLDLS